MHTSYGDMDINVPRGRKGEFEPQVVKKYQNTVTQDMEEKIIYMYANGMTTADIESHMRDLNDFDVSDTTISRITDKSTSSDQRMAGKASGRGLRGHFYGRHPLPSPQ